MAKNRQEDNNVAVMEEPKTADNKFRTVGPALKFKLVEGQHAGRDKNGEERLWRKGEIVECYGSDGRALNLAKRFNSVISTKFQPVHVETPSSKGLALVAGNPQMDEETMAAYERIENVRATNTDDIFETMTIDELRTYCEQNEIDVEGITAREPLLEVARQYENKNSILNQ